jgi:hypothetical protein
VKLTQPLTRYVLLTVVGMLFAACANQMEPAKKALDGVASAVSAAAPDAAKYMPDALAALQKKLADLQASFDRKDYRAVLMGAPSVLSDAQSVALVAAARAKAAMTALGDQWASMSSSLPNLMSTVKARVDALGRTRQAPKGVDLASAQSSLADAMNSWTSAQASFAAGQLQDAVSMAKSAAAKAAAAAAAVNLKLPAPDSAHKARA